MTSHLKIILATCFSVIFLSSLFSQTNNTATGTSALYSNTTGSYNVATGVSALYTNTSGSNNIATGYQALYTNTTGSYNVATGVSALYSNTTGISNVATGCNSLYSNTTGITNVAIGGSALVNNLTGNNNAAIGTAALGYNSTGSDNSALGYYAGRAIANGSPLNKTGSNSVFIGSGTKAKADAQSNQVVIGYNAIGNGSNTVTLGNDQITNTFLKGNVGIGTGTTAPAAKLDVGAFIDNGQTGTIFGHLAEGNTTGDGTYLGVKGYGTSPVNSNSFAIEHHFYGHTNSSINFFRGDGMNNGFITFNTNDNTEKMRIDPYGKVGIGTTAPDQALTVKGKIHAEEVIIDLSVPVADFVFHPTYKLMPLHQVESYVKTNSHLPEMPSAEEVSKNGMSMGEMQNKLLQKVEELTLYAIEQQKTINQQSAKIEELEKRIK